MPECPKCRCIKVEDWGEAIHTGISTGGLARRIDGRLQGLADSFGMTDINNRDGQAAKRAQSAPDKGKYGTMNFGGVDVPIGDTPVGAWGKTPYTAFSAPTTGKLPGRKGIPTQIVAEHKG